MKNFKEELKIFINNFFIASGWMIGSTMIKDNTITSLDYWVGLIFFVLANVFLFKHIKDIYIFFKGIIKDIFKELNRQMDEINKKGN